ncbi:Txe/YoeB family addiction module toxin [Dyadobacter aurulentus]|uniref:Txe/YoeB family addiction module toxin n=1 Tax=Dyadobacter sp. UC 10 TaxID=2605428 RepID=UPI0011F0E12F|nr:Txe/YoeB family addiction module toxin [Dyadobacter sp. UC 10]KAA0991659.1 Txe/YoeB family addiction module toxin [Dyadobacter sp. UC 10]
MGYPEYKIEFSDNAADDLRYFLKSGQLGLIKKIKNLIDSITENPASGIGKPELLKHNLAGYYSRRIDREHRIIYKVDQQTIRILSLRGHY